MASKGRNGDSMLVHMTPGEVAGLHALAVKHGGELTINPDTGLPEANFLKSLLPMLAGAALNFFVPGLGAAVGGAFGVGAAAGTGIAVGGLTTLATGSLSRGLMAGMGAYGGAGLAEGLGTAGLQSEVAANMPTLAGQAPEQVAEYARQVENVRGAAIDKFGGMGGMDKLSAGFDAAKAAPGAFLKDNLGSIAAAASPILADAMVPTTTKMPSPTDTGYIRQKVYDPGTQTYRSLTPVKANEWKDRSFSDIYRGYNGGGIVALAGGGMQHYENGGLTAEEAQKLVDAQYATIGRTGVGTGANQIDEAGRKNWTDALVGGTLKAEDLGSRFSTAVTDYMAQNPADQYTQYVKDYQANQASTGANATTGGVANLATTGNTAADTSGINALNNTGAVTGGTSLADAQAQVNNMYRNVLGRDADPTGLAFWSNAIASGRPAESIYQDFLASARSNTELVTADQIKNKTFAEATTPYKGYMSSDTSNIVDDWVRNTLGREPTDADKQQQWYKDAYNKMTTSGVAKDLYGQFQSYAGTEVTKTIADRIKEIDAELRAKNLTDADLLAQTGKTKQQLATEGLNTGLNWMGASQLAPAGARTAYDLQAKLKALQPVTTPQTNAPAGTTNPYGNKTNPGDLTKNADGTITVQPNIPYRPYGGFSGMGEVSNAYTQGGGSLGYTPYAPKTAAEHAVLYNNLTGDSEAAYNYLMGKGAYPTKSGVGEIAKPYKEATLGYAPSTNKAYNYDAATGKMVRNPDYVAPSRDSKGNVTYGMSLSEIKKYLGTKPLAGQELYNWAQSNDVSAQDVADATGRKLSDVYAEFRAAAKKAADTKAAGIGTGVGESGSYEGGGGGGAAAGGMMGYAVGGGLGTLGSYSDGGRLLKGPGDGVSDSIPATIGAKQQPARLADGEFVIPARIVSELGNGSTDAGAKKLYAMMDRVQKARGKTTGKNKVAANSRAEKYLPA
jgi:hypothetical protein